MTSRRVEPATDLVDATITVPGSKSMTNRALVAAALASGTSRLHNALRADDTDAMRSCLASLGAGIADDGPDLVVIGTAGRLSTGPIELDVRMSGTTARFIAPVAALGAGPYRIDGHAQMRDRPMGDLVTAMRALGAPVGGENLPLQIGSPAPPPGGAVTLAADVSSQFLSGLLLAGPYMELGVRITPSTPLVSEPYLEMTVDVMRAFGAAAGREGADWFAEPGSYVATDHWIEPDASSAGYFFAAAAITGGRVRVDGLGSTSSQGDAGFVDLLERMGVEVKRTPEWIEVHGPVRLRGIDADLRDLSDMVPTLAVVAAFADGPTRIRGVGFIRRKESDRIGGLVAELRRSGIEADATDDGLTIAPGVPRAAVLRTYDDHRMAMALALLGLRVPGVEIADPDCVAKTFPTYWDVLAQVTGGRSGRA